VAQDHRKGHRVFLIPAVRVSLTDPGGDDPDQHLVGARRLEAHGFQPEWTALVLDDGGFYI
jgi:hypothetical protein